MARVLMPLPDRDFDVTEVAVPWKLLSEAGHDVVFATERAGTVPAADPLLISGVLFGKLGAADEPKAWYGELERTPEFRAPLVWNAIDPRAYDGLLLPGGHAPGMKQYLGSDPLQRKVADFWLLGRPISAICHGVLVLARARHPHTGRSLLADRGTTCLPKYMERLAHTLTFWKLGRYFRTYPDYVEDEVKAAGARFIRGPITLGTRGTADNDRPAFVVEDGPYLSARWPGDAYLFTRRFIKMLPVATPSTSSG
ncbi:MAG: DJ-1/PfpI family protein [Planctomycetes bacterium]|nr:DJ-1/PfpI family protein [Planctomycetota bacterium]